MGAPFLMGQPGKVMVSYIIWLMPFESAARRFGHTGPIEVAQRLPVEGSRQGPVGHGALAERLQHSPGRLGNWRGVSRSRLSDTRWADGYKASRFARWGYIYIYMLCVIGRTKPAGPLCLSAVHYTFSPIWLSSCTTTAPLVCRQKLCQ